MSWEHVVTGAITGLVAIAAIRRWRSHSRGRDIHITFDWRSHARDDSKEDNCEPDR